VTQPRLPVVFWDRAARQIEEANDWWRKHREGSPEALSEDLVRALDIIARQPGIGTPAASLSGLGRANRGTIGAVGEPMSTSFQALRQVIPEHVAAKIRELGDRYGIRNIRVFGSFARGDASPGSGLPPLIRDQVRSQAIAL